MNEAALLAACDLAPHDPVPRLVLADWLEEAGTPGRAAAARLVRQSAGALQAATPVARGVLTRVKNWLSKKRPSAVAWFEWWFLPEVSGIIQLHRGLDRRRLARFAVRCVRETITLGGNSVADHLEEMGRTVLRLLERYADGHELGEGDWQEVAPWLPGQSRALWPLRRESYVGLTYLSRCPQNAVEVTALALADPNVPTPVARWEAVSAANRCAGTTGETFEATLPACERNRRLLHECVPCPFDPEGDG